MVKTKNNKKTTKFINGNNINRINFKNKIL